MPPGAGPTRLLPVCRRSARSSSAGNRYQALRAVDRGGRQSPLAGPDTARRPRPSCDPCVRWHRQFAGPPCPRVWRPPDRAARRLRHNAARTAACVRATPAWPHRATASAGPGFRHKPAARRDRRRCSSSGRPRRGSTRRSAPHRRRSQPRQRTRCSCRATPAFSAMRDRRTE